MLIFDQLKKNDPHLRTLTWVVMVGLGILAAGLWQVQVFNYRHYSENQKAQSFRTVRIPAIRGKILDRQGEPLAENQPSYTVGLYFDELRPLFKAEWSRTQPRVEVLDQSWWQRALSWCGLGSGETPRTKLVPVRLPVAQRRLLEAQTRYRVASNIVQRVAAILRQPITLDFAQFAKHYQEKLALPFPVATGLTPQQIARFQEHGNNPPGLDLEVQPARVYPHRSVAAHLLGYLARDNSSAVGEDAFFNYRLPDYRGRVGIEGEFDADLRGRAGVKSVLVNSLGYRQSEMIWTPAAPGKNVVLTIDLAIQKAAEEALHAAMPYVRGAAVVIDPTNGDILALASAPGYDPNLFIPGISEAEWRRLSDEQTKPQMNRAVQQNYQPGSVFKIVTALACLESGLDPKEVIHSPGFIYVGRRPIGDEAAPGDYDFRRAFIKSSNTYFITNGLKAGVENIVRIGQRLHLGERCGLPTRQEVSGNFPTLKRIKAGWSAGDTANLCMGQGVIDITPLQVAVMISAIANGGKVYWPRLVARLEPQDSADEDGPLLFEPGRVRDELGVSARTLQLVREAMLADVEDREGTGKAAAVPGLKVCGKTGTAQVTDVRNEVVDWITWFASFAPYENPRYVVVVMIESGQESGHSGGRTCAPVAQKIYQTIRRLESGTLAQVK